MNKVFLKYLERNPSFVTQGGKVSIIAHSLGSVIIHDVLTLWNSHLIKEQKKIADPKVASGSSERFVFLSNKKLWLEGLLFIQLSTKE